MEALFCDPAGNQLRALHVFRRSPIVSITIPALDPTAALSDYCSVFGCREVTASAELAQLYLPLDATRAPSVAAVGPIWNTTSLVFDDRAIISQVSPSPAVITLAVADIGAAYSGARRLGWECSVFQPGAASSESFTCLDRDGNLLHVVPVG